MRPFTRRKLWFALFVVVVFAMGIGTGLTLGRYLPRPFGRPGGPGRPPSPSAMANRMQRDLGLDALQRKQIEEVFARGSERLERFHATTGQQFEALRQELNADIERVLTPEQRVRFRQLRPDRGPRRPPPPGAPPPPPPGG